MRRDPRSRALETAVIVGEPTYGAGASFSLILESTGEPAYGMLDLTLMSPFQMSTPNFIHRVSVRPPAGRGQGASRGGRAGRCTGHRHIVIEEAEASSEELEESDDDKARETDYDAP